MGEEPPAVWRQPFLRTGTLIAMGAAVGAAVICLAVVTLLPPIKGPLFEDPLRSFLTGAGVAGIAFPLCALGFALKRRFALSPYFEGAFIAGVLNLAGYICAAVALVCIGFGMYDLVLWLLGSS
ncbi:MAG: hypothetical protein M1376_08190 [Planctomycetes bacterium]|nr:hypothetical protein [Planctomycetota bacterium]